MLRTLLAVLLLTTIACDQPGHPEQETENGPPTNRDPDRYAVYDAALGHLYLLDGLVTQLVVHNRTPTLGAPQLELLELELERLAELDASVVQDLQARSVEAVQVENRFDLSAEIAVVDLVEVCLPSIEGCDYDPDPFPDAAGLHKLTEVGFDPGKSHAAVCVQLWITPNNNQTHCVHAERNLDGGWQVREAIELPDQ
jgi:hypothetical protein